MSAFYKHALPAVLLLAAIISAGAVADENQNQLPRKWEKWLKEEVVHIISSRERELFLKLETEERREKFEEMFWQVRDPTQGTAINEYREEHQRRIEHADKMFGYDSPGRGALTDRGRIYISLGPPRTVDRFPSGANTLPMELWFYETDPVKGLPPFFYLIFFKRFGTGDYVLYNPIMDGPQALVATGNPNARHIELLKEVDAELARASLNYLPSGQAYENRPSLSALSLLYKIENVKEVGIDATYAQQILLGKEVVTTEYSFSTYSPAHTIFPSVDEMNRTFIDFAFELPPEQMDLGQYEEKIYGALRIDFRIGNPEGSTIHSETDSIDLSYSLEEFETIKRRPMLYEKRLPCIPGKYSIDVSIKNEVSRKQFYISSTVDVPMPMRNRIEASQLLLAQNIARFDEVDLNIVKPLQFADVKLSSAPATSFANTSALALYCQLFIPPESRTQAPVQIPIKFSIVNADGEEQIQGVKNIRKDLFSENGLFHFFMRWPLQKFKPGSHSVLLQIETGAGGRVLVRNAGFSVTGDAQKEPLHIGGKALAVTSGDVLFVYGKMLKAVGDQKSAITLMLAAYNKDPRNSDIRSALARLYFETEEYEKTIRILQQALAENPNDIDALRYSGLSYFNQGEHSKALKMFTRLILQEGESTEILNLLGKCCLQTGQKEMALDAWQRSLALDPNQEDIKKMIEEAGQDTTSQKP